MAYNDIFSKNIEKYWKNEGCNNRMQKYYKFSNMLKIINKNLKYILLLFLIVISTITIFELSSGNYITLITNDKSEFALIIDIIKTYLIICLAGLISYIISIRFNLLKDTNIENFINKFLISVPMYYLLLIYIVQMNGLILVLMILMIYLLIININYLFMKKINYLYDVSIGKAQNGSESSLDDIDVIVVPEVKNKFKKEKENKKYARKR